MAIKKQEYYEGAALFKIINSAKKISISRETPFFLLDDKRRIYLKYSTANQAPWSFTFSLSEQSLIAKNYREPVIIGLICGGDGVVALPSSLLMEIANFIGVNFSISCRRSHGSYYEVAGPDGISRKKIAPSDWDRMLVD